MKSSQSLSGGDVLFSKIDRHLFFVPCRLSRTRLLFPEVLLVGEGVGTCPLFTGGEANLFLSFLLIYNPGCS